MMIKLKVGDILRQTNTRSWRIEVTPWDELGGEVTFEDGSIFEVVEIKKEVTRFWSPKQKVFIAHATYIEIDQLYSQLEKISK